MEKAWLSLSLPASQALKLSSNPVLVLFCSPFHLFLKFIQNFPNLLTDACFQHHIHKSNELCTDHYPAKDNLPQVGISRNYNLKKKKKLQFTNHVFYNIFISTTSLERKKIECGDVQYLYCYTFLFNKIALAELCK